MTPTPEQGDALLPDVDASASAYVAEYVMTTEGNDYVPTDWERRLIEDALHGFIAEHGAPRPTATPEAGEEEGEVADAARRIASWAEGRTRINIYRAAKREIAALTDRSATDAGLQKRLERLSHEHGEVLVSWLGDRLGYSTSNQPGLWFALAQPTTEPSKPSVVRGVMDSGELAIFSVEKACGTDGFIGRQTNAPGGTICKPGYIPFSAVEPADMADLRAILQEPSK